MNSKLTATATRRGGWFERGDAIAAGYTDDEIARRVRQGGWIRLCRGAYAERLPAEDSGSPWDREFKQHVLAAKAIYRRLGGRAIVSHQSALLLHGVEIAELDLSRVHVTRVTGFGRSTDALCQHAARPPVSGPVEIGQVLAIPGPRAVVEAIRSTPYWVAVAVVDAALRQGVATAEELSNALELFQGRSGIRTATTAVSFGDGLAESVGESRLRVLLADLGFPAPVLQVEIRDAAGRLVGRVDFLLAEWGVIVEFDGAVKYAGGGGSAALVAEKVREDRLRDLGYEVVRAMWTDFLQPEAFATRLRRAIERSHSRNAPNGGFFPR